jgi:xylulokinase
MHGVVLVDERAAPLRPAILWLDQRAAKEAAAYAHLPDDCTQVTGNEPSPGMAGPILAWLGGHEPRTLGATWWALQPKDWLRLRLTGQAATDPSDASGTLLFDLTQDAWADDLIKLLGVPRELLPPVRPSAASGGALLPAPAAELALPPGIRVTVGAADTAAALYAASLAPGDALLTVGSGAQWAIPVPAVAHPRTTAASTPAETGPATGAGPEPETAASDGRSAMAAVPPAYTNLFRAVGDGCYRLAPVQNAGITLNWVRTLLGVTWDELYATAARPCRPGMPVFAPYLTPERWQQSATGAWSGLTLAHDRDDLLRSALDGVATLLGDRLADLRHAGHAPRRVILSGGGATHPAWRDLLAETLGLPVTPAPTPWLSAAGAARLASESRPPMPDLYPAGRQMLIAPEFIAELKPLVVRKARYSLYKIPRS